MFGIYIVFCSAVIFVFVGATSPSIPYDGDFEGRGGDMGKVPRLSCDLVGLTAVKKAVEKAGRFSHFAL